MTFFFLYGGIAHKGFGSSPQLISRHSSLSVTSWFFQILFHITQTTILVLLPIFWCPSYPYFLINTFVIALLSNILNKRPTRQSLPCLLWLKYPALCITLLMCINFAYWLLINTFLLHKIFFQIFFICSLKHNVVHSY